MDASQYKDYVLTMLFLKLSWSHYVELLRIDDERERSFYEKQAIHERWSEPELKRQPPGDLLREPYVFEFLKTPEFYQQKSSVDSVQRGMLADMWMALFSKEEQIAIATILTDIDQKIQILQQRFSETRQLKQGMMQQLLTGKTRLVVEVNH